MALATPFVRPPAPTSISIPSLHTKSPRPTTIQRRSTLKRSIDEIESMNPASSPSKRSRVTFDSEVETFSADEDDHLDPLLVKEEVRRAIQRHLLGDDDGYEKLKTIFSTPYQRENAPSTPSLRVHLQAVLANISGLDKSCYALVHVIIHSEWIGRDNGYFTVFTKFLGNLAAAQAGYLGKISQMLVELLGPQKTRRVRDGTPVRQRLIHTRALQALQYISQLVPTASDSLAESIRKRLTWEFAKPDDRITFVKSFMDMIDYVPQLTSEILTSIMSELIKLDVSVQADLDDEEEDAEEDLLNHMSSSQILRAQTQREELGDADADADAISTDDSDSEDIEPLDEAAAQRQKLKADIRQVDLIMDMLFRYYTKAMSSTSLQTRDSAMALLNAQFHNLILPTYRSRHPQFLIFHFAQSSDLLVDEFVASCISVLMDKKQPQMLRHSAAAYFSGFVGRGSHVSPDVVSLCVGLLCDQLNVLRKAYEPGCRGPDIKRYSDFYATMQAILYIFCFRWRNLALSSSESDDDSDMEDEAEQTYEFPDSLKSALHSAILSPLNPLRVLTPVIVDQFANLTFALRFMYIHSKIETNKNVRLHPHWRSISDLQINQPERDLSWVGDNGVMEGYFPYDPYHLPMSKHWLDGDYVQWQGIPGEVEEESDEEEDEDEEREMQDIDDGTATEED